MLTTLEMTPVRRKGYFDFSESPVAAGAVEKWESRGVCRISKGGSPGRHLASTSGLDGGIAPYHLVQPSMGNVLPPQSL